MSFNGTPTRPLSSRYSLMIKMTQQHCQLHIRFMFFACTLLACSIALIGADSDWMQNCSMCHCHWISGKKMADCRNRTLTAIPDDLSNELQVIDLSHNMIPELRREEFVEANLQNLHKIYLKNCTIQELNRDALKGLPILIELDLSYNFIKQLHVGTFNGLVKLRNLIMNNNQIETLENYLFTDLPFLSRVEFKNNHLKRVEVHAFGQLPILSVVYLESNQLTVLKKDIFQRAPKLIDLRLAANPWNCTCELQEFRDFVVHKQLYTPPTNCYEPPQLKGKLWIEIPSENFACKPNILGSVRSFVEAQSDNITLPCRVEGSPRPNITWLYNKRPINSNDARFRIEEHNTDTSNMFNSELRIFGVRSADKGAYTCIAENRGGRAEAEFQLLINGDYYSALDGTGSMASVGGIGSTPTDTQSNILLIICLITISFLLLLIVVVLIICWYCRRIRTYQKDTTMLSENGLITTKPQKNHNGSILEGSVIMEMQKSLLTEVNPVEKPPRRTDLETIDGVGANSDDGHDMKKTLLDETRFGKHHSRDDETHSASHSDVTTTPRSRHTYIDDTYVSNLPPDLLAFPARVQPTSPSMQSSQSNIPDQIIYGIRSPTLTSPVYAHMTPHGIYGTTTIAAATPNGFMTLQHPKNRNIALIAAANNRQPQSPFVPAPVVYSPVATTTAVVMKQGYMTIPRKPRVPSWAPSSSATNSTQLGEFQSPTSPIPSETGTATTAELTSEPVYDNLGLRTTAGGSSTLNLNKNQMQEQAVRYNMRDRPLPATPSLNSANPQQVQQQHQQQQLKKQHNLAQAQQLQQQQQKKQQTPPQQLTLPTQSTGKLYEPLHELANNLNETTTSDTEPLYNTGGHNSSMTIISSNNISSNNINNNNNNQNYNSNYSNSSSINNNNNNSLNNSGSNMEPKLVKIPPRPPPKPKKKMSVTTTRNGQGSTSQLFDDEGEDGTEV